MTHYTHFTSFLLYLTVEDQNNGFYYHHPSSFALVSTHTNTKNHLLLWLPLTNDPVIRPNRLTQNLVYFSLIEPDNVHAIMLDSRIMDRDTKLPWFNLQFAIASNAGLNLHFGIDLLR